MRRRGAGALESIVVGSVANKLFSKLIVCPLLIAGRREANDRVLIAIDGSTSSFKAVDFVAENLGGHGYGVCLLHVIRGFGTLVPDNPEFMMPSENVELAHVEMMRLFGDIKEKLILAGFNERRIEEKIITGINSRAGAIVEQAVAGNYGTIVVGRKGLSRVQEFFMGRVSTKVIHAGREFTVWMV
jgi:nucleotide-binding universal stress UspA family protein